MRGLQIKMNIRYITKPECFLAISTAIKCMCEHFWAFLRAEITDFPTLSYTSTREIPTLLHARSPEINVPRIVKYMEYGGGGGGGGGS